MASENKLFWILGLTITLPAILLSGPLIGYLIGIWIIQNWNAPSMLLPILMSVGLVGSGIHTFLIIKKIYQNKGK